MDSQSDATPQEELAQLAGALSAQVRRQRARGLRRSPRAAAAGDPAAQVRATAAACTNLEQLRTAVAACTACGLAKTRTQTVFADGQGSSGVLFVGEAPGADEDRTGVPFVGRAGQLLTDIITKGMGLQRSEVWIANVLKCRPPDNRDPTPAEKATCTPFLDRQIELMRPKVVIPLGRHAAMHLLRIEASMSAMRGRVHERDGLKIVPTFHPAYLLRSPSEKKECWKDIQRAMDLLGLVPPKKGPA
jgi:DNA polymerase